jgi:hypothetical protein
MKLTDKLNLAIPGIALGVAVITFTQTQIDASHQERIAIRNAYSLGQVIAGRVSLDSLYMSDRNNPTYVSGIKELNLLAQQYAQNLSIDPRRTLDFLADIDKQQQAVGSRANLLTSPARTLVEREIGSRDLDEQPGLKDLGCPFIESSRLNV